VDASLITARSHIVVPSGSCQGAGGRPESAALTILPAVAAEVVRDEVACNGGADSSGGLRSSQRPAQIQVRYEA
jgi:hypothetical protein